MLTKIPIWQDQPINIENFCPILTLTRTARLVFYTAPASVLIYINIIYNN